MSWAVPGVPQATSCALPGGWESLGWGRAEGVAGRVALLGLQWGPCPLSPWPRSAWVYLNSGDTQRIVIQRAPGSQPLPCQGRRWCLSRGGASLGLPGACTGTSRVRLCSVLTELGPGTQLLFRPGCAFKVLPVGQRGRGLRVSGRYGSRVPVEGRSRRCVGFPGDTWKPGELPGGGGAWLS